MIHCLPAVKIAEKVKSRTIAITADFIFEAQLSADVVVLLLVEY